MGPDDADDLHWILSSPGVHCYVPRVDLIKLFYLFIAFMYRFECFPDNSFQS